MATKDFTTEDPRIDPLTGERRHGPIAEQVRTTLDNMKHMLESAGSSLERIVKRVLDINKVVHEIAASAAAISGELNDVLLAMNLSPLIHSDKDAEVLAREMLLAHEALLPNFAKTIAALK